MKKKLALITLTIFVSFGIYLNCFGYSNYHEHNEESYQRAWQQKYGGILEFKNDDGTRVDILTPTHAIEFDFANKWAESVGQALYYEYKTGKKAKVILILEHPECQMIYFKRVKALSKKHGFDAEYITPEILNLDCNQECQNPKCKCHKKKCNH